MFWPLTAAVEALAGRIAEAGGAPTFPPPEVIDAALGTLANVRFERQRPVSRRRRGPRDPSMMYDARIIHAGCVPTRPGSWHDLMNALVWATFPLAKRALHERQHGLVVLPAPGVSARRPRELDALALLDEGGLVVVAPEALDDEDAVAGALMRHEATAIVFGHAIYEGIILGREAPLGSAICVRGNPVAVRDVLLAHADRALSGTIADRAELLDPSQMLRLTRVVYAPGR